MSSTPVSYTPNVYKGNTCNSGCKPSTIYSTVVINGEVVVAGAFSQVCTPASTGYAVCPSTVTRNYIFAFNLGTGAIDPSFTPVITSGPVYALAAGPGDTVYAGGSFTSVNGSNQSGVAELYVDPGQSDNGQLVPGFTGQVTGGTVNTLAFNSSSLYVGGVFNQVGALKVKGIARLNGATGADDTSFAFKLGNPIPKTSLQVGVMSLSADGSTLAIGGTFLTVNGLSIPRIALIHTGGALGSTATLANWSSPILANNCSSEHDYVFGIDISPDGSFFVVGTTGYKSAGGPSICDAVARFETGATGSNVQPTWTNYSGGDTFRSIAITGSVVYVGGHNRWVNNECGNNEVCEDNAVLVNGLSAMDVNTGLALPWWQPQTARGVGVQSLTPFPAGEFAGSNGGLLIGTDVNTIGGATHSELAMFPLTSTAAQTPGGPILSGIFSNGRLGGLDESTAGIAAMCVDDPGNSSAPGTAVQFSTCNNSLEQNWTIQADSTVRINGLCVDTQGGGTSNGTPVILNTCSGAASQQWRQGTGNILVNQASGTCLDDPGASTSNGTQLQISSCNGSTEQVWPLPAAQAPPPPPATGPVYPQVNQSSTQVPCLIDPHGAKKAGTPVELWTCLGFSTENWTTGLDQTIRINGLCLDTTGGTTSGTLTVLNTCNGSASQVWTPGAHHSLVNQASNLCLDDPGSNTNDGEQMQIWFCNGGPNQAWWLPAV